LDYSFCFLDSLDLQITMSEVSVFCTDNNVLDELWTARRSGRMTDVTIVCHGGAVVAHRLPLIAASRVIAGEILGHHAIVVIADVSVEDVELMLRVVYAQSTKFSGRKLESFLNLLDRFEIQVPRYAVYPIFPMRQAPRFNNIVDEDVQEHHPEEVLPNIPHVQAHEYHLEIAPYEQAEEQEQQEAALPNIPEEPSAHGREQAILYSLLQRRLSPSDRTTPCIVPTSEVAINSSSDALIACCGSWWQPGSQVEYHQSSLLHLSSQQNPLVSDDNGISSTTKQ